MEPNKILTVCPSIHPELFESMSESFYNTSSEGNVLYEVSTGTVTEAINFSFNKYPDFDFYHITNDDVKYLTPQWDTKLANKHKISYGNDLLQMERLPTFPMIDGDIVRAIGWLQFPGLKKYSGDQVWQFIGKALNILEYHGDIFIKHKWQGWDEAEGKQDFDIFVEWVKNNAYGDIEKARKVING